MSTFARLHPRLQHAIATRLGWPQLRPVQELAGAAILDGANAVVLAPTAGGKTEAALFPTLSLLLEKEPAGVGAVYVAPIKALLNNQEDRLGQYTEMVGLGRFVWHGDAPQRDKARFCKDPAALLMTTPESLEVMLVSSRVPTAELFSDLRIVVIDEVHAFAGTDRGAHLMSVLERLARLSKHDVQRVGLSATVGNPDEILAWLQGSSQRPGRIVDPPRPKSVREITVRLRETRRCSPPRPPDRAPARRVFSVKAARLRKPSPNGCVAMSSKCSCTIAPFPSRSARRPRLASPRGPTPASSARRRWS